MIGYLGKKHTKAFYAASTFYMQEELIGFARINALFKALEDDDLEGIVLPFERTVEANIYDVLGLVLRHRFHINRDILYTVRVQLYSKSHDIKDITKVIADEASFIAHENVLNEMLGEYQKIYVDNPVVALNELPKYDEQTAALSISEMEKGDYHILISDAFDGQYNVARYIYVTKSLEVLGFHNKISILCQMKHNKAGSLYTLIHEFALKQIDITNILFVDHQQSTNRQVFFIEFYANFDDDHIKEMLDIINYKTDAITIVGSYFSKAT